MIYSAAKLALIVSQYPNPAMQADFEYLMEKMHKSALAKETSYRTGRPCNDPYSFAKKFKALGFKISKNKWIDAATLCIDGKEIRKCDPGHEKWREDCEISWKKK